MASAVRTLPTPLSLDDFDVGVTLGTGSFGRVRFATHKVTFGAALDCTKDNLILDNWIILGSQNA
jgi:hypothetical protein